MASKDQFEYLRDRVRVTQAKLNHLQSYYDHRLLCVQALMECETDEIRRELIKDLNEIGQVLATLEEI